MAKVINTGLTMKTRSLPLLASLTLLCTGALPSASFAAEKPASRETITLAFQEAITSAPGRTITAMVVDYAPGGKSLPHRHGSAFVVGYVLQGAIRSQVNGGKVQVFRAGEHWVEQPGAHHTMSENASTTQPAKLLALFVAEARLKRLVTFDQK